MSSTNFSFIHTADIHLGRPFSDISESDDKTRLCNTAIEKSFNKIVDTAITQKVDFVLISGDSFDSEDNDLSAKLLFIKNLKKLADNGVKVYVICGNHDPIESYKKNSSYFQFGKEYRNIINIVGVTTDDYKASFSPLEGVNIHAISYITEEGKSPIYDLPKIKPNNEFNIALIHCDLDKTDSKYSPVSREDLRSLGYDYYALGHIHIPEIKEDKIVYSGSPQGRTKKETGEHGCYLVKVENNNIKSLEFTPTDFVRFYSLEVDCSECLNKLDVFNKITDSLPQSDNGLDLLLCEINLIGVSESYSDLNSTENLLREYLDNYTTNSKIEVYRINNHTTPKTDEEELLKDKGVIGIIANTISDEQNSDIDSIYNELKELHECIYKQLPIESDSKIELLNSLETEKEKIKELTKNELKSVCSEIYNS